MLSQSMQIVVQLDLGIQAADAVAKLHELNVVHRDVSPTNILYTLGGVYKLADFGIATLCQTTMQGATVVRGGGTAAYKAPGA